jgi:hypothetical protein
MTQPLARAPLMDLFAGMNKTEKARAIELEGMKRTGQIAAWWYEKWTFKLADDLRYTPDFVIQKPDGALEVEEVKGFWREDARAKVKMFVALYPFAVRAYTQGKRWSGNASSWDVETFR